MTAALEIIGVIFLVMAYLVTGPILGERLQETRRKGVARLDFPGNWLLGYSEYLDSSRYRPEGLKYIRLLWVEMFLPIPIFVILAFVLL